MGSGARLFDTFNLFGMDQKGKQGSLPGSGGGAASVAKNAAQAATQGTNQAIVDQQNSDAAATQALKDAKDTASNQASNKLKQKAGNYSQTVYTSPLGLTGQASTSKKVLLGQ